MRLARRSFLVFAALCSAAPITLAQTSTPAGPRLHHVGLNSVDPEKAIAWYLKVWPSATRTTVAGYPAVQSDMLVLFNKVDRPPAGAWRNDLHRAESQSAFWHIGANINTTDIKERLNSVGVFHLPLFIAPSDTSKTVWRSGLAPYTGTPSAAQLANAAAAPPRDGGFSYVVAPDGVLFELTGGPGRATHSRTFISITSSRSAPRTGTSSTSAWSCRRCATRAAKSRRALRGIHVMSNTAMPGGRRSSRSERFVNRQAACDSATARCRGIRASASTAVAAAMRSWFRRAARCSITSRFSSTTLMRLYAQAASRRREGASRHRTRSATRAPS